MKTDLSNQTMVDKPVAENLGDKGGAGRRKKREVFAYRIHYIGSGLYGRDHFVSESKKLGVNRPMPFSLLNKFKFGDEVLLGTWEKRDWRNKNKRTGQSTVFGYYTIDRLVLAQSLTEMIKPYLTIVSEYGGKGKEEDVERACGNYVLGGGLVVKNSIEEIVRIINEVARKKRFNPNIYKYFLAGKYYDLSKFILIKPISFTRTYISIELDMAIDFGEHKKGANAVEYIFDYHKRKYIKKEDAERLFKEKAEKEEE